MAKAMSVRKNSRVAGWFSPKAALSESGKGQGMQQSVNNHLLRGGFGLLRVGILALTIAFGPVGRASAETLEIPQASPSLSFDSGARADPASASSPGGGAPGASADYAAQAPPASAPQAQPMPQIAGIDQYMNQDGRNNGYAPGNVRDPRNSGSSSGGAILMGGLMVGLIALDIAINHHR
jgi:hypothetical protein